MGYGRSWRAEEELLEDRGLQSISYISQGTCTEHRIHHPLTCPCCYWNLRPQVFFLSEETEVLPTDQLWLDLSSGEKEAPIWSPLVVLQKHSIGLLGISVSHRSTDWSCRQESSQSGFLDWTEEKKLINKNLSQNACWGTLKKTGKAQWQQILNGQLFTFLSRPAVGWVAGVK